MTISTINSGIKTLIRPDIQSSSGAKFPLLENRQLKLNIALLEECLGSILVFTDQEQLIYANSNAQKVLSQLHQVESSSTEIPGEIRHIYHSLIQSRHLFPNQNWVIEFDIVTTTANNLHIRSRWITIESIDNPCLLLLIEDRHKDIIKTVLDEADRYGLTPREKEVWLLQHNSYTYKQIATELGITPNTVKKHMRSIHAKRKAQAAIGEVTNPPLSVQLPW